MKPGTGQRLLARVGLVAVVAATAAVAAGALVIHGGFSTRDEPSAAEAAVARGARALASPARVRALAPPRPVTAGELAEARAHWAAHCAICHGVGGAGDTDIGRNLYPRAPDMRGEATQHLTDGELYAVIKNGVRLTGMPAWGSPGDGDLESWALVAFIRTLPALDAAALAEIASNLPRTPHQQREADEEADFLRGAPAPSTPAQEHHP